MADKSPWNELIELTRVRVVVFLRSPEAVFWVFGFPLLLAAVLGFAFQRGEAPRSRIGIVDDSAPLVERLRADVGVDLEVFETLDAGERALRVAKIDVLIIEPRTDPPRLRMDEARQESALAQLRVERAVLDPPARIVAVDPVRERGSRYVDFLFPGLLGMNLMGTGMWSIGFSVAEMRQRRLIKRLLVTPMRRASFMASFLLARLVFLVFEVLALTLFGALVLGVPFRAGLVTFAVLCTLGAALFAGLGLLVSSRAKSIEAVSGLMNLAMMPMWLLSGVFFSYERFPEALHPVLRLLPLTALNDGLRATTLEGRGLLEVLPEIAVLTGWTVVPFVIAMRLFRWN